MPGVPTAPVEDTAFSPGQVGGRPEHLPWDQPCHQRQGNRGCREHPARDRRGVSAVTRGDLRGFGGAGEGCADVGPGHQWEQPGVPAEMLHWRPRWGPWWKGLRMSPRRVSVPEHPRGSAAGCWEVGGGRGWGQGHGGDGTGTAPTHTFAGGARKPSGAGLTTSSSLAFLASWAGGTLDTSGTLGKEAKG